jgi:hypothetical protein
MPSIVRVFGAAAGLGVAMAGLDSVDTNNSARLVREGHSAGAQLSFPPYVQARGAQVASAPEKLSSSDPFAFTSAPTPGPANTVDTGEALAVLLPAGLLTLGLGASACSMACRRRAQARQDNAAAQLAAAAANPAGSDAVLTAVSGAPDQRAAYRALRVAPPDVEQPLLVHVERPVTPTAGEMPDRVLPHGIEPSDLGIPVRGLYIPSIIEERPSDALSWELAKLERENWQVDDRRAPQGFEFVRQSEGRASVGQPLVSVGFTTCSAFLIMNIDAKDREPKCLMFHHDSGFRSTWKQAAVGARAGPASPCTPTRGFIGRPRVGYDEFQKIPGRKLALLIESDISCDRREQLASLESEDVSLLPPLTMKTVPSPNDKVASHWSVVYRPESDELMIHFRNSGVEKVMHFEDLFYGADLREGVRRDDTPRGPGDFVDRMSEYRTLLRRPGAVSENAREAIELCLKVVELRHVDIRAACVQLRSILDLAAVRDPSVREAGRELKPLLRVLAVHTADVDQWLRDDLLHKGSEVILGLTQLVDHLLAQDRQGLESK